ncbi:MAG TPA: formyltransferase family protein [Bacteroidota bacterium]|nr:formyltransferase family protein [Bacteroidota bacterium]
MNGRGARIVMCGCTETGYDIARYLLEHGVEIAQFVTISPEKAARVNASGYRPFGDLAARYGVPVRTVNRYSLNDGEDIAFFRDQQFDLLIQGGWQRLFPADVLATLRVGGVGVHGSSEFLPKGRGRSPVNWSLIEGKERFILHFFLMTPGIDDGDVFHYEMFDVNAWDTCRTLYMKIAIVTKRVLERWIPRLIAGDYALEPQQGEPSFYPARRPADGRIDWSRTMTEIYNFIRAQTRPYPGAFTTAGGARVNIWGAQPFDTRIAFPGARAGEVLDTFDTGEFVVNCNSGLLLVTESEPAVAAGEVLGT